MEYPEFESRHVYENFLQIIQTFPGVQLALYSMGTKPPSRG